MPRSARRAMVVLTTAIAVSVLVSSLASATPLAVEPALDTQGPGLSVAEGGVGLEDLGSDTRTLTVNIGGAVQKAFLYWAGRQLTDCPQGACFKAPNTPPFRDQELVFDGTALLGNIVGTEDEVQGTIGYMADVTTLVQAKGTGAQSFSISDGDLTKNLTRLSGAGLIVVYTDPVDTNVYRVIIADGLDFAYGQGDTPLPFADNAVTSPVTFSFAATAEARTAQLTLFAGDGEAIRPDEVTISNNATLSNTLDGSDGHSWDTDTHSITVPANAGSTTVQLHSAPRGVPNPDSLLWTLASLRVPLPKTPGNQGCTPGYWKNHHEAWAGTGLSPNQTVASVFTLPASLSSLGTATLDEALAFGGGSGVLGGGKILLRAAVASMLNAGHGSVAFSQTTAQVKTSVDSALSSNNRNTMLALATSLDTANNGGCPLN